MCVFSPTSYYCPNPNRTSPLLVLAFTKYRNDAQPRFHDMVDSNRKGLFLATLPYKIGIFAAVTGAAVSIPMIFHLETVLWFNELYVTTG
jgi:hypothetical protein